MKIMSQLEKIKQILESMQDHEIQQLLGFLRQRSDIIIPKCFTRNDIMKLLVLEGFPQKLSDAEFTLIKQDYDDNCIEIMREYLRTNLLITFDRTLN